MMELLRTTTKEGGQQILENQGPGVCECCGKLLPLWGAFNDQRSELHCGLCVMTAVKQVEILKVENRDEATKLANEAWETW